MSKKVLPSIREHHAKMLREIDNLMEAAEYGRESNESITVYYQPIESAARNIAENYRQNDDDTVLISKDLFDNLLDSLQMPKIGDK